MSTESFNQKLHNPIDSRLNPVAMMNSGRTSNDTLIHTYIPNQRKWGKPAPIALAGLFISIAPLACQLMGWRGASGSGAANNGAHYFCGGLLMLLGGILSFFSGDTLTATSLCGYGGFWLALGGTLTPAITPFAVSGGPAFYADFAFFFIFMSLFSLIIFLGSLRTNIPLLILYFSLFIAYLLLAPWYWNLASGNLKIAARCEVAGGAALFITTLATMWLLLACVLEAGDAPFRLPVGDLSGMGKGREEESV